MRMLLLGLACLVLLACSGPRLGAPRAAGQVHNVTRCEIYGMDGRKIRQFPGRSCVFFPDGRVAAYVEDEHRLHDFLIMYDGTGAELWRREVTVNHQLNLDRSGSRILAIVSEPGFYGDNLIRGDDVEVIDLDGKVLHRF